MNQAPAVFISHGAPTFALEPGVLGPNLRALGASLRDIQAILVVSPHWQTRGVQVMTTDVPATVHDFGGFPRPLYSLHYPAKGAPALAREAAVLLSKSGHAVTEDSRRGLDHGAWVPLLHLFPDAQVPVFQVSMPLALDAASAMQLGKALAPLRAQGVMIIGSGSLTHNLYEFRQMATSPAAYATEFENCVRKAVLTDDATGLVNYRELAPHAVRAHPTDEHFLPLLVAMGARSEGEPAHVIEGGVTHGVLSMESYAWGVSA